MIEKIFAAIDLFAKYVGKTVVLTLCGLLLMLVCTDLKANLFHY